ncbi:hypothetical protein CspHIS471_0403160 [Cutaneotrichosporon sp. HIS471]|nr:hypothetical protein CspHIS471_0403160 [Cutaneotrichosporon sp. HIS471]
MKERFMLWVEVIAWSVVGPGHAEVDAIWSSISFMSMDEFRAEINDDWLMPHIMAIDPDRALTCFRDDPYAISYLKFQDEAEEFMLSIEFIMPDEFSRRMNDDEILQLILSLEPDEKLRGKTRRRPRRNI